MPSITNQVSHAINHQPSIGIFLTEQIGISQSKKKKTSRTNLALSKVVVPAGQMEEEL
jgi:ascorbate-specific PTS system EIIC-type component UlaA